MVISGQSHHRENLELQAAPVPRCSSCFPGMLHNARFLCVLLGIFSSASSLASSVHSLSSEAAEDKPQGLGTQDGTRGCPARQHCQHSSRTSLLCESLGGNGCPAKGWSVGAEETKHSRQCLF